MSKPGKGGMSTGHGSSGGFREKPTLKGWPDEKKLRTEIQMANAD